jgi:hypothetical protein
MFFFGIILILNGIHEDKIKEAEKNVKIQYRFVPRSYYDEQVFSSQFESKFSTLFDEDQDEWSANQRVFTPYNINDFGSAVIGSSCIKEDDEDDPRERELMPDYSRTARLCYPGSGFSGSGPVCDNSKKDNDDIINLIMDEIYKTGEIYEEDEVDLSQSGIGYVLAKVDTILLYISQRNYTDMDDVTDLIDDEFEELKEELQRKNNCIDENNALNERSEEIRERSANYRTIQKTIDNIEIIKDIVKEVIQSNINLGSLSVGTSGSGMMGTSGSRMGTSGFGVGTSGSRMMGTSYVDSGVDSGVDSDTDSDDESDDGVGNNFRFSANANLDFDADASVDIRA